MHLIRRGPFIVKADGYNCHIIDIKNKQYYMISGKVPEFTIENSLKIAETVRLEGKTLKLYIGQSIDNFDLINISHETSPSMWICVEFLVQCFDNNDTRLANTTRKIDSVENELRWIKYFIGALCLMLIVFYSAII